MKRKTLKGKVVIITGSSQGIGKATAIHLCKKGAHVVLNGRSQEKLFRAREELMRMGHSTLAVQADITSEEDCKRLITEVLDKHGRIDVLINNGSSTMNEQITRLEPSVFASVYDSNSMGAVYPTLAALPYIEKTKGSIVFISSLAGLHGLPSASAYSMGKMALTALWQSLKIELSKTGIHFGICYVSFTQNEQQKRMITSDGTLIPVPKRPKFIQQSRETVASRIVCMLKRRQSKMVLSPLGKITAFTMRYFPRTVLFVMTRLQKKSGDQ